LNARPFGRHHAFAEKRAFVVTGRDSVPVAESIAVTIAADVSVAACGPVTVHHETASNKRGTIVKASPVETSSLEAVATEAATASRTSNISGSLICADKNYGDQ
jgi:hypothetical protein